MREDDVIMLKAPMAHPHRVKLCLECLASKTPIWRSGPGGNKTLCNACGIRYKRKKKMMELNGIDDSNTNASADLIKLSAEEMKQNQREKQLRVLKAMMQQQWKRRKVGRRRARRAARRPPSPSPPPPPLPSPLDAGDGERDEAVQAALLLLSLSSGVLH